jgi:uncharacterized lipoprotein YbaY
VGLAALATLLGATPGAVAQTDIESARGAYIRRFTDTQGNAWTTLELNPNHTAVMITYRENELVPVLQVGVWTQNRRRVVVNLMVLNARPSREQLVLVPIGRQLATVEWDETKYGSQALIFSPAAAVTGRVTYRERVALPPGSVVEVRLLNTSLQDASSVLIGRQIIPTFGRQVPIPFEVLYDPASINRRDTYGIRARIFIGEELGFTNLQPVPVITQDKPSTDVEVVVTRAVTEP